MGIQFPSFYICSHSDDQLSRPVCKPALNSLATGKFEWNFKQLSGTVYRPALNSLAPGKFEWNFKHVIFKQILLLDGWGNSCETALIWMSLDITDDQSTLVQVMAWCRQATSHYLSQCWPRSLSPYGVNGRQCGGDSCICKWPDSCVDNKLIK